MSLTGKDLVVIAKKHPVGVGCAMLSVLLLVFGYLRSGKITEVQARLDEVTATGERLERNIAYAAQLTSQLEAIGRALDSVKLRTVQAGALAQNLQYFYKLEADCGAKLTELRQLTPVSVPGPKNASVEFVTLPFNVGVQGDFSSVMTFLRKLENGEYFGRVNSATLRPSEEPSNVVMTISVELLARP